MLRFNRKFTWHYELCNEIHTGVNKCVNGSHLRISEHLDVDIDTFSQCCDAQTVNNNVYSHLFSHRYEAHSGYQKPAEGAEKLIVGS